jgi:transcriptional regulator with XRE-family HTH domain
MLSEIKEVGKRIRGMRDILDIPAEEMARVTGVSLDEYLCYESGEKDFSFTFLYKASQRFGIDLTELITGESPHLSGYTLVRKNQGLPIERRRGFYYQNLAAQFRDRLAEPFLVTAPAENGGETADIPLNSHDGQEMDFVLSGAMRIRVGENEEILREGDTIYYDASRPHGMIAIAGQPCRFLAIVLK